MNNNDIIRRVRYTFDLNDDTMIKIFGLAGYETDRTQISNWLKKDDDEDFQPIYDQYLSTFLNGFIVLKRGKKNEDEEIVNEKRLNNNQIVRKLKIALQLKDVDIMKLFELAKFNISKHEISAIFRNPSQKQYRECKDQFLRNFLHGMQIKYRRE